MSFLQPFILWGLPLVLIPVLVHLLNRLRYRTVPWATLMFLLAATKHSTRQARVREWLILALRVLAVLMLVFAVARPLVGGWLGGAVGAAPDTILLLLDRSASMEAQDPVARKSKRELALSRLAEAARAFAGRSRFAFLENAARQPQDLAGPDALPALAAAGPSDTAADIPAMLEAAFEYVDRNQCGQTEIWLASDQQKSSWRVDSRRWAAVRDRQAALRQPVRVRLLALTQDAPDNLAIAVRETARRRTARGFELALAVELSRRGSEPRTLPLTLAHEGARSQVSVTLERPQQTVQLALELGAATNAGWGWVELPADANPADNRAYFTYAEDRHLRSAVVATTPDCRRFLPPAAAPAPERLNQSAALLEPGDPLDLADTALLIWQAPPPTGAAANAVRDFVEAGGVTLRLPAGPGEENTAAVTHWRTADGVLANSREGRPLPLNELAVSRREAPALDGPVLAAFGDGRPLLVRKPEGRGATYALATRPDRDWSSLHEGVVLVPMLQRMLQEGGRRLSQAGDAEVGALRAARVECLAAARDHPAASPQAHAGVYRADNRLVAVNRPAEEDEPDQVASDELATAMGGVPFRLFEDPGGGKSAMPSEIWRWMLLAMLLFLTGEALLAQPEKVRTRSWASPERGERFGEETERAPVREERAP